MKLRAKLVHVCILPLLAGCQTGTNPEAGGGILWQVAGRGIGAPAVSDSTVYVASLDHHVLALDARTGQERWNVTTGVTLGENEGRNVLIVGNLVIVPDAAIHAFDRVTGERRWTFSTTSGDLPGRYILSTDGVRVFAGSPAGFAYALDATTGQPVWIDSIARDNISVVISPVVNRGLVVLSVRHDTNPSTGGIVALDAATGVVRWRVDFPSTGPGRGSGSLRRASFWGELVVASSDDGTVYAMDRETGAYRWTSPRPADITAFDDVRPLAVVGSTVVVGSDRAVITGLDTATGSERWRISGESSVNYEIGSDGTRAYVVNANLRILAIDVQAGKLLWVGGGRPVGDYTPFPVSDGVRVYASGLQAYYALRY